MHLARVCFPRRLNLAPSLGSRAVLAQITRLRQPALAAPALKPAAAAAGVPPPCSNGGVAR